MENLDLDPYMLTDRDGKHDDSNCTTPFLIPPRNRSKKWMVSAGQGRGNMVKDVRGRREGGGCCEVKGGDSVAVRRDENDAGRRVLFLFLALTGFISAYRNKQGHLAFYLFCNAALIITGLILLILAFVVTRPSDAYSITRR
ncbi:hypothetical protein L2E82_36078 [Cichorium intybus]|uniref:Uncharacterized protein n=1 Tax=Cichorium intybus TaxID=13427 RepID=A0ACB9BQJ0_CICIN|nr:hypothetical protein L2E82_36078 [Cichorium intybus]